MAILHYNTGWCTRAALLATAALLPQINCGAVMAQQAAGEATSAAPAGSVTNETDIIVTARKRSETLIAVPVTVSAVTAATLSARGISNLEGIARTIPTLFIAGSSGGFQGGAIGLRGISAGDGNVFGDQAVAFNIDGVQIARSTPRQFSDFDIQQVEVLKGPQALYYGKNSPGGIVVLHSGDPTSRLEAGIKVNYEINAREVRSEAFLAGPLTEAIGARVAVLGLKSRGDVRNTALLGTPYTVRKKYSDGRKEFGGRVTLKYDDGGPLTARFKFLYGDLRNVGPYSNSQLVYCPLGVAQHGGSDDCGPDDRISLTGIGTRFGTGGANTTTGAAIQGLYFFGDGQPRGSAKQYTSGLELSYDINDNLTLTSATGYYDTQVTLWSQNSSQASALKPTSIVTVFTDLKIREISEEIRLTSSFAGPINFMIGGFYQDQDLNQLAAAASNAIDPVPLYPPTRTTQDGISYSLFGSLSYKPTETVEISGGARYSYEKKKINFFRLLPGAIGGVPYSPGDRVPTVVPSKKFDNVSPEATISWRPTQRFTVYGSWKRGFLSGGFNPTAVGTGVARIPNRSYLEQVVEGFEGGMKGIFLDGTLRVNAAAYNYKIKGLQVNATLGNPIAQVIANAAGARVKGVEGDFEWQTPLDGLSLRGALAYNKSRYTKFGASSCYTGQTIAMGCNPVPGTTATTQNLGGAPLVRAPEWGGAIGGTYEVEVGNGNKVGLSVDGNYSSKYFTDTTNSPGGVQHGYWLLDASARYEIANGLELAFVGRNLTQKYYFQRSTGAIGTGTPAGRATGTLADQSAFVSRGRELTFRIAYHFR